MAIQAGCDMLIYRTETAARHAYTSLQKALDGGNLDPELVLESVERITELKKESLLPYHPVVIAEVGQKVGIAEHLETVAKINPL